MHRYIIVKSLEFVVQCSTSTEYFGSDSESGSLSFDHFTKQLYYQNNVNNDHRNLCNLRNITLPAIFTRQRFTIHLVPLQWIVNPWITKISSSTPPQNSNDSRSIGYSSNHLVHGSKWMPLAGCLDVI